MVLRLSSRDPGFEAAFAELVAGKREVEADVNATVAEILADVRARGDRAVIDYSKRFDDAELTPETLAVPVAEIEAAARSVDVETLEALKFAAKRIEDYHRRQLPENQAYVDAAGVTLGSRPALSDFIAASRGV